MRIHGDSRAVIFVRRRNVDPEIILPVYFGIYLFSK
jgi:hypothetical protein